MKSNPDLASIEADAGKLKAALESYFNASPSPSFLSAGGQKRPDLTQTGTNLKGSFLGGEINDPSSLRKRIADLEKENEELKKGGGSGSGAGPYASTNAQTMRAGGGADWMKFNQGFERPTTASQNNRAKDLEEELKYEKKDKVKLVQEVENLKREI